MPRLWSETVESHRREVGDAILDTTVALVGKHGLRGVTMSLIARETGIGRATLYKYYPDVEAILTAWHERHVAGHLEQLAVLCEGEGEPRERLGAVLEAYALIRHEQPSGELAALLHRGEHVTHAQQHLHELIRGLLSKCVKVGTIRRDVAVQELASFCVHATSAASSMPSKAAVRRLVTVILTGLQPTR